ncbi:hypothetical protein C8J57DRAFT_1229870 [Mycena rebaudengoi]|nr:hypothetical protein C8J57DRAFT_1229870 [Mycena rebaudengoi]
MWAPQAAPDKKLDVPSSSATCREEGKIRERRGVRKVGELTGELEEEEEGRVVQCAVKSRMREQREGVWECRQKAGWGASARNGRGELSGMWRERSGRRRDMTSKMAREVDERRAQHAEYRTALAEKSADLRARTSERAKCIEKRGEWHGVPAARALEKIFRRVWSVEREHAWSVAEWSVGRALAVFVLVAAVLANVVLVDVTSADTEFFVCTPFRTRKAFASARGLLVLSVRAAYLNECMQSGLGSSGRMDGGRRRRWSKEETTG